MGANSYLQGAFFLCHSPLRIEDRLSAPLESSDTENSLLLIIHIINLVHHSYWVTSTFCWPGVFHTHNDQTQLQQQLAALCLYRIDPFRWARLSPLLEQALASLLRPLLTPFHFYWAVAVFFFLSSYLPFVPPPAMSTLIQIDFISHLFCLFLRWASSSEKLTVAKSLSKVDSFENTGLMLQRRQRMIFLSCNTSSANMANALSLASNVMRLWFVASNLTQKKKIISLCFTHPVNHTIQVMSLTYVFRLLQDNCTS